MLLPTARLFLVAGLASTLTAHTLLARQATGEARPTPPAAQPARKPVATQDDLPRHTYTIEGKASEFILSDAPFKAFVEKVKANALRDLAEYQIDDRTTLQGYYQLLQQVAMFEGQWDESLRLIEQIRGLEAKEAKKLMTGQVAQSYIAAVRSSGTDQPTDGKFVASFKAELDRRVRALPWDTVKEEVNSAKGRAEMIRREMIVGSLEGALDPVVAQNNGEVSGDLVKQLVAMRIALDKIIPLNPAIAEVFGGIAADHESARVSARDIWSPSQVALTEADRGTPVVIGIWDSGVDGAVLRDAMWTNPGETPGNSRDDDGNGFIDDVHGIAFDLDSNRVPAPLADLSGLRTEHALMQRYMKGFTDVTSNVQSDDAAAVRKYISELKKEQVTPFTEDLGLFSAYCHGTHVAGIAAAGNPYARILAVRISFDHHAIPSRTPSIEQARKDAQAAHDTIDYLRKAGARVVNMSWGGSRESIESDLEKRGWGKTPEERASLSREIFAIQRDALDQAMRSAPEILFIAAAGNSDNDNQFSEFIPSGLDLPNMITVGAIDQSGKPTGFTTFGRNVRLYANGFEVDSYLPGGERQKMSGTSMAAPNVANLAGKLIALDATLTTEQVIDLITRGAEPLEGHDGRFIINPRKSIDLLRARAN